MRLNEKGRLQVLQSTREIRERLRRRLETLRLQLSDIQQEVDDLVGIVGMVDAMVEELEKVPGE